MSNKHVARKIPTFSKEQIERMFAVCDLTTREGQRNYTIILLLLETGIRVSELCNLHIGDIQAAALHVVGKGNQEHHIEITPAVSEQLMLYMSHYHGSTMNGALYVFVDSDDQPLTPGDVSHIVSNIKKRAGVTGVGFSVHTFRHTFASLRHTLRHKD
ncbi:tyrosine-type recombinase/integrase [Dictyobacter kobayashii]|uniref:Tyr recombinase domain-containing protein n=1 Tax=Dictyobacter kobayashii TaxID=2014872 RepID=A0A402AJ31_9CHLR|nr:tyrosine-type recombinase/integrase [Dictyobacter kobayashii]GCE19065.1 hypothetical protein KDK_28650 [Dictyobacter kobayashii]